MTGILKIKTYDRPEFNKKEILRYSGCKNDNDEINALIDVCIAECVDSFTYKVCFREFDISFFGNSIDLTFAKITSADLRKNLDGCSKIILFAATIGLEIDRLIMRYSRSYPAKALIFQAIGAERIETLCDIFNNDMNREFTEHGQYLRPRFSPGYGDLPLGIQQDIFNVLDCRRKIGITLNKNLLMTPTKSVTAIIGVSDNCLRTDKNKCNKCNKTDCVFREEQ